jgi:hypothetical protein
VVFLVRKIGFYLFIVASIVAAVWGYLRLKENKEPNISALEHIPGNVSCVIETNKCSELVSKLTRQNLIWNALLNNNSLQVAQNGIRFLDSLVNSSAEISEVLSGNSVYWAFLKKEKTTEHVILFKVKEKNNEALFLDFFEKVFAKETSISSFDAFYFTNNNQKWLVSYKDGIVYVSSDVGMLQNCIELNKAESLAKNNGYLNLLKENGDQNTQIYFNHSFSTILPKNSFSQQSLFGMDVKLNEITFTGYSNSDSSSLFSSLKNQGAESIHGFELLPNNPDIIEGVTLSDVNLFYKNIEKQRSSKMVALNTIAWQTLNDSALYNIKAESFENIDQEIISGTYVLENITSHILSIKIKDNDKAEQLLKWMSDSVLVNVDSKIYKLNKKFERLFLFTTNDLTNSYALLNANQLLLFSNQPILNYYLKAMNDNEFLGKNLSFMSYAEDNLTLECNYVYYENSELMKAHNLNSLINSEELWMSENVLSQLSLTVKNSKNNLQVRINASHAQPKSDANNAAASLWAFKADSAITNSAHVFINHLTQENELCFQDELNQLYLINSTGNLIWKKKLTETIKSEIYTVDIFKNGKFQMLFNTDNYLHLIDRNGNYVQGFPVKLPSKATAPINLLDYDGTKDWRIFVPCADKRIYNFNLFGIKTEGFIPVRTDDVVALPICFVRIATSDYLITADVSGKIYAFSRKGEGRIDFKNKVIENLEHLYVLAGNSLENTKLIYLDDKNNLLNKISLADKKEVLKIGDELNGFKASFALVNDDSQSDMLVYGNGAMFAYDLFTSKLIEYYNELAVYDDAQVIQTSDNSWFLGFDKTGQKIDVINTSGKLTTSLTNSNQKPLVSNLYKNGKSYVLLVGGNKITCQELK